MKNLSCLHLTDLHCGIAGQKHLWPNVREAFFDDLKEMHDKTGPWSIVFFTGDLVQCGSWDEFKRLNELLGLLWERFRELGSYPLLLTVPGNHDLQRPDPKRPAVRLLTKWNDNPDIHDEFWMDTGSEYRKIIDEALANYQRWLDDCPLIDRVGLQHGILPGDFSVSLEVNEIRLGVVGINTGFLQLAPGQFEGRLAWDQRQLQAVCQGDASAWIGAHDVSILMTHHGPTWLNPKCLNEIAEVSPAGRFLMHFFGHMHVAEFRREAMGGGPTRRLCQGNALFGLEKFGEEQKGTRQHGYSIVTLRLDEENRRAHLRFWPRSARRHAVNGWEMVPDHDVFSLEGDGGTQPEEIELREVKNSTLLNTQRLIQINREGNDRATQATSLGTGIDHIYWPYDDPTLRPYCDAICRAHSHIRFVEIPKLQDTPDVELDNLYVNPMFTNQEIDPDAPPTGWPQRLSPIEAMRQHRHIALLGDPGAGKSTLVSCLSWQLCRPTAAKESEWTKELRGCVPLPMILRELHLKADITWEGLLDAFLEHRIGSLLQTREKIETLLRDGRAIVLLDGVDEIGNLAVRRKLKDAVHTGIATYPQSRWIVTSRIVGYDRVPFHVKIEKVPSGSATDAEVVEHSKRTKRVRTVMANLLYLAPFDDYQIKNFSLNWYAQHEKNNDIIQNNASDFVSAIQENEGTQRLARIPYLLTLMALIHHKNLKLPHGRTDLYERIATAYLESIDLRRQLDQLPYSLAQKKRWLADIAYRMQLRRENTRRRFGQGEILANKSEVQMWLRNAMAESGARNTKDESEDLLDYFARRSGLLLQRGEGKFAFMHLSLQEYFAACFLEPRLAASRFLSKKQKVAISDKQLRAWVNSEAWCETFVLLFELLAEKSVSETEGFLHHLFGERLNNASIQKQSTSIDLLAQLATDPFVLLTAETRRKIRQRCWRWAFSGARLDTFPHRFSNKALKTLLRESGGDLERAWVEASISPAELRKVEILNFTGCNSLSDLKPLCALTRLKRLVLGDCTGITDLTPLSRINTLEHLGLQGCSGISTLEAIPDIKQLKMLVLGSPLDLSPLSRVASLRDLHLHYDHQEIDLTPLVGLRHLQYLCTAPMMRRDREGWRISISSEFEENPGKIRSPAVRRLFSRPKYAEDIGGNKRAKSQ